MAMGHALQFRGVGVDKYDAVKSELGWLDDKSAPPGILAHAAGATADGFCVIEWWTSTADWEAFFERRLQPAFQKVGGLPQPEVVQFEVHSRYPG
jgi:hypothetical protein